MSDEFQPPSIEEIAKELIGRPGGLPEGFADSVDIIQRGVESGVIRSAISCEEAIREWFTTSRSMYVEGNPEPRFPIDAEVGIHIDGCSSRPCQLMLQAYWQVLRPSKPSDSSEVAEYLDKLEFEVQDLSKEAC